MIRHKTLSDTTHKYLPFFSPVRPTLGTHAQQVGWHVLRLLSLFLLVERQKADARPDSLFCFHFHSNWWLEYECTKRKGLADGEEQERGESEIKEEDGRDKSIIIKIIAAPNE